MAQPIAEYSVRVKKNDDGTYTAKCPLGTASGEVLLTAPDDSTLRDRVKEVYKGVNKDNDSKLKYSMQRVWIVRARLQEEKEDEDDGLGAMFDLFD